MDDVWGDQPVAPNSAGWISSQYSLGMRILVAVLIALLLFLNVLLWKFDDRGLRQMRALEIAVQTQKAENAALTERNSALEAEVKSLKEGLDAVEERARADLGMMRKGETFFHLLEESPSTPASAATRPSPRP